MNPYTQTPSHLEALAPLNVHFKQAYAAIEVRDLVHLRQGLFFRQKRSRVRPCLLERLKLCRPPQPLIFSLFEVDLVISHDSVLQGAQLHHLAMQA
jgi:hypothetical protein